MSKIPEGATHTYTIRGKTSYRRMASDLCNLWEAYIDGDWTMIMSPHAEDYVKIQTDQEWNGDGLPPVGVEIEVKHKDATPEWARPDFYKAEIVAIGKQLVIFAAEATGCETVGKIEDYEFRPVRTPEQIFQDERLGAAYGMCKIARSLSNFDALHLYDAGLRFAEVTK